MTAHEILGRLNRVKSAGPSSWMALCPGHDDHDPSLSVTEASDGKVMLHCFATSACTAETIVNAMGLTMRDLMPNDRNNGNGHTTTTRKPVPDATYDYVDADGQLVYQVVRYPNKPNGDKDIKQRRPDGKDGWIYKVRGMPKLLYHLPDTIAAAKAGRTILIVEGEKDCDRARTTLGLAATTNSEGAGKWPQDQSHHLTGARVIIIPDNDPTGRDHAQKVAASVAPYAARVQVVELPGVPVKGDLSDYLDAGGTIDDLTQLVRDTPQWEPHTEPEPVSVAPGGEVAGDDGILNDPRYRHTDVGNAKLLVAQHGRDLRYCEAQHSWYVWTGTIWKQDKSVRVVKAVQLAKSTVQTIFDEATRTHDDATWKHARKSNHAAPIAAMLKMAETEPGIPILPDDMDCDPWLLNCPNGTVDLRTGELREHRREDLMTKLAGADYDPAAECPTWLKFLEDILPDREVREFVQRAAGYSLTGSNEEDCWLFLYGRGANGKTTLLEALLDVAGDYGHNAVHDLFAQKQTSGASDDVAALRGTRFVVTSEVQQGKRMDEAKAKQLTGGDTLTARKLYENAIQFKPTFTIWQAGNHKHVVRGTDEGIWRRIHPVPFEESIPEEKQDKGLAQKLQAEYQGILAWCVRGCLTWQRGGLEVPEAVKQSKQEYRKEEDVFGQWLEECTVEEAFAASKASDLHRSYQAFWMANVGGKTAPSARGMAGELKRRGYTSEHRKSGTWWLGLTVRTGDGDGCDG